MTTPKWDIPISVKITSLPVDDPDASTIAGMFGLSGRRTEPLYEDFHLSISPGEIIVVTGPSGGGKTSLLRAVAESVPDAITLDLDAISTDSRPAVACLENGLLKERLVVLSRCGLADARTLITPAEHLSGGQLYRLAMALAVWRAFASGKPKLLLVDEFASTLDSATAGVLASGLRKLVRRYGLAMIISTPRDELLDIIKPDLTIVKPLNSKAYLTCLAEACPLGASTPKTLKPVRSEDGNAFPGNWKIERGTIRDYRALSRFHYLTGPPAAHKRVWTIRAPVDAMHPGTPEVAAVLVVSPPVLCCRGRNVATGKRYVSP
ncbi:MAG: ATP-binding cassette domain-containing protein, partial [Phycisphaerae bacterium]|nr:ATP-binding cassette domain-containing protein [Phycisphaerae bacterium]